MNSTIRTTFFFMLSVTILATGLLCAQSLKLTPDESTTYVTGPLTRDGFVDYPRIVNDQLAKINRDENAAIDYMKKVGFRFYVSEEDSSKPYELLGTRQSNIPQMRTELCETTFLSRFGDDRFGTLGDQLERASHEAWTLESLPFAKSWMEKATPYLDDLDKVIAKPHCIIPVISRDPDSIFFNNLDDASILRMTIARPLACRANLLIGQSKTGMALDDVQRLHRLARVKSIYPSVVSGLHNASTEAFAADAGLVLLNSENLTADLAKKYLAFLNELDYVAQVQDSFENTRLFYLSSVCERARRWDDCSPDKRVVFSHRVMAFEEAQAKRLGRKPDKDEERYPYCIFAERNEIDWNTILQRINKQIDEHVRFHLELNTLERLERAGEWQTKQENADAKFHFQSKEQFDEAADNDLNSALAKLTDDVALIFDTSIGEVGLVEVELRTRARLDLTRLICAFRVFEFEHGHRPESAADLNDLLGEALIDPYSGKPYLMKSEENLVSIYSVYKNGEDDDGKLGSEMPGDLGYTIKLHK